MGLFVGQARSNKTRFHLCRPPSISQPAQIRKGKEKKELGAEAGGQKGEGSAGSKVEKSGGREGEGGLGRGEKGRGGEGVKREGWGMICIRSDQTGAPGKG